ncbi:MAG: DNA primase [Clostridia bacterium]|nr:DNA primase [Clostridia bacterium]
MAVRLSDDFLEQIRDRNDIESVISGYVELKRRGRNLVGLCPFHNEKTASFTVYPETSSYYCFGCHAGGDVITFIRNIENLDYVDSVKFLADRSGIKMPDDNLDDTVHEKRKLTYELNRAAAKFFHECLFSEKCKEHLQYFVNRGLTKSQITRFGLGAAPDDWHELCNYLVSQGFKKDDLVRADLVKLSEKNGRKNYYDNFRNRVIFPVIDLRGNVVAFGGRVLDDSKPKYINTGDTPVYKKGKELFALNLAKNGNNGKLILCEGYMDVIALHKYGFTNAIAGLGTALTPEQVTLISRYAEEVYLCYDSDEAGQKAVRAALSLFSKTGVKVKVIMLSGAKDPDEILSREGGKDRFQTLLDESLNAIEYYLYITKAKYNISTADGRRDYLNEASKLLSRVGAIERDVYASKLADELNVDKNSILTTVDNNITRANRTVKREAFKSAQKEEREIQKSFDPERTKNLRAAKAEDILLISILNNASFYNKLKNDLTEELFITPLNKRLLSLIIGRLDEGKSVEISFLAPHLTSDEMSVVAKLFADISLVSNTIDECVDCINVLKKEKEKQNMQTPSAMGDQDFLDFFASLKKSEDEKK